MTPVRTRAFTLIELLVVVAILGILVALLMPALSAVRAQSRAIRCTSNLHRIGSVLAEYASENRGVFPASGWYLVDGSVQSWVGVLQGKYGGKVYIPVPGANSPYPSSTTLFCPNNGQTPNGRKDRFGTYGMFGAEVRYAVGCEPGWFKIPLPPNAPPATVRFEGWRTSAIRNAGDLLLVGCTSRSAIWENSSFYPCDQGNASWESFTGVNTHATNEAGLWASHNNRVGGLFADWHVELCDKTRLFSCSNRNGNTTPSVRPFGISYWRKQDFTTNAF